jgi:hypothetical protein
MIGPEDRDDEKTFLQRWSRLKRANQVPLRDDSEPSPPKTSDANPEVLPAPVAQSAQSGGDPTAFDASTLPPIESISASSDIRAFLAPGVPEGIKRAALRRAWIMDPAIREFIGVAENQWDFNKPDSIPGFGSLELTPELCRMIAGLFSDSPTETTPPRLADTERGEQVHIHEISAEPQSSAIASAPRECDPKAGRSPALVDKVHADAVELASTERPKDEPLQPIPSKKETSTPK